jgi:glutamate dehydrogenase
MDMSLIVTHNQSAFLAQLAETISAKFDTQQAAKLQGFANLFFDQYPINELKHHDINDVIGMLKDSYDFLSTYKQKRSKVRVFNPSIDKEGWACKNTVITVHYNDVPFVIDSVRMALTNNGLSIKSIKNLVVGTMRAKDGNLVELHSIEDNNQPPQEDVGKELLIYIEVNRHSKLQDLNAIAASIRKTITDVNVVNNHYTNIIDVLQVLRDTITCSKSHHAHEETYEANQFLAWLMANNFTFLGYAFYQFVESKVSARKIVAKNQHAKLSKSYGLLNKEADIESYFPTDHDKLRNPDDPLITFSKSPIRSTIHRRAYPDHITVQAYDNKGNFVGVHHIIGLYTSQVYRASVKNIPCIRQKVNSIYEKANINAASYNGKVLRQVLETFPRDELFQSNTKKLEKTLLGITQINERSMVRLFMRKSVDDRFVNVLAYIPRDQFSTTLREKIIDTISLAVGAESSEFYSHYSESILSRTYIIFRLDPTNKKQWSEKILEEQVQFLSRSWVESLSKKMKSIYDEEVANLILATYKNGFPNAYQDNFSADTAIHDIEVINQLSETNPISLCFSQPEKNNGKVINFKVFNYGSSLPLSDVIPVLERMNLKVIGEHPYKIKKGSESVWLHDFLLHTRLNQEVNLGDVRVLFEDAFTHIWQRKVENDAFNGLVLSAQLTWRDINLLRAYAAYMKQITFPFSRRAIVKALMEFPLMAKQLVALFYLRFDPNKSPSTTQTYGQLKNALLDELDAISNLNHDRILRQYLGLIEGTVRTNYFQQENGMNKEYVSFKMTPRTIANIPEPRPLYEIFVYSARVEGVHLRGGKVSRGGLRWSDRAEDFRTEVLGLVKAQSVKNAVIVPSGAKGGFVAKRANMNKGREALMKEGIACYQTFIRGLLDITDNIEKGKIVPPENVIRQDEDDPYLVVAADKGTATFSDIANRISLEYHHWLGDAFASGGSVGYDHKAMGITAKGAWVSVRRHFKEKGIDVQKTDFTVVGIGDMAGDVFGNGMLMSEHIRLVAAFNHLHIFVDPNPNAAMSYKERQRLFTTPGTNWADYNQKLISNGGGIFSRDAKSIPISEAIQQRFDIHVKSLSPNELISAILRAPVDLIWNGGIGTYVKAGNQSHGEIGDKANDAVRVNGSQLRCKVFGEGGNLGMSQLGRIEYSMDGGACNTDFIDNAAGVDCSDHEVNIKILLSDVITNGGLSEVQRNRLLASMTDNVAEMVLKNNYYQTQSISLSEKEAFSRIGEYRRLINALELKGRLNRELEFIPTDQELLDRTANNESLTRPELSVLNCYVKVELKELLAVDEIADNPYLSSWVERAFPEKLVSKYKRNIHNHILRKEIIATQLANDMVNNMGITFCHRMMESTGESAASVAIAYVVARDVFQFDVFKTNVESLDYNVPADDQLALLISMMRRVRRGARWFLRNRHSSMDLQKTVDIFKTTVASAIKETPTVLNEAEQKVWREKCSHFESLGLAHNLVNIMAMPGHLFSGLGIAEAALQSKQGVSDVVIMHHLLGDKLGFHWFAHSVTDVKVENYWQAMARETFIDDIDKILRSMTVSLLRLAGKRFQHEEALQLWMQEYPVLVTRWRDIAHELQTNQNPDFAMFSVAMRELTELAEVCQGTEKLNY